MQILCAYKFELMPTGEQARNMRRFAGACRFVFNKALALQNENHRNGGKFIGYVPMAKHARISHASSAKVSAPIASGRRTARRSR